MWWGPQASFTGAEIAALIEPRCIIGSVQHFSEVLDEQLLQVHSVTPVLHPSVTPVLHPSVTLVLHPSAGLVLPYS